MIDRNRYIYYTRYIRFASDQASVPAVAAVAAPIQQTKQEDHHQVNHDWEQNGDKDLQVQLSPKFSHSPKNPRKWSSKWNFQVKRYKEQWVMLVTNNINMVPCIAPRGSGYIGFLCHRILSIIGFKILNPDTSCHKL